MLLSVAHDFLPKTNSTRAAVVMDHFGIDFEQGRHVIADQLDLPVAAGDVVLFTGASGSGKSSLMRGLAKALQEQSLEDKARVTKGGEFRSQGGGTQGTIELNSVVNLDDLILPNRLLIDALPSPVDEAMNLLSACGLGEAHLMLRTPAELSDGQRYRFRLALALSQYPQWVVADEFTATLDRTLARVIAFNIRRLSKRTGTGFLLATTHEDVIRDLAPDLHVQCRLDGLVSISRDGLPVPHGIDLGIADDRKKKGPSRLSQPQRRKGSPKARSSHSESITSSQSPSSTTSGFPMRPDATGRTLLAGITAATTSGSSNL